MTDKPDFDDALEDSKEAADDPENDYWLKLLTASEAHTEALKRVVMPPEPDPNPLDPRTNLATYAFSLFLSAVKWTCVSILALNAIRFILEVFK